MSLSGNVWQRQGQSASTLTKNSYAGLVCGWTAFGIGVSAAGSFISRDWELNWILIIAAFAASIVGAIISAKSDNPTISFLGYMIIALPFGLLLGPIVAAYTDASVTRIFVLTTSIVVVLGVIGAIIPTSLEHWGVWLFGGLLIVLGGMLLIPLLGWLGLPIGGAMTALDWFGVILFSGYVIYDLNRAMRLPFTMDNSVDAAVAIYLDFFNIFIRLLSLFGDRD